MWLHLRGLILLLCIKFCCIGSYLGVWFCELASWHIMPHHMFGVVLSNNFFVVSFHIALSANRLIIRNMDSSGNNLNLVGLSISEDGPSLTSRTPPPPGFNGSSMEPEREKSTSFNNLAMALGTGLAESMDNSTSDQQQQHGLQRMPTPSNVDNYTRQSRHLASRLVGGAAGGSGGMRQGGGFDYLNPSGTGHHLIPPSNNAFLEKLKAERESAGANVLGIHQASRGGNDFLSSLSGATSNQQTSSMNSQVQSNQLNN